MLRPQIFQVIPQKDYTVYVFFDDGSIRKYDANRIIKIGGRYEVLKDINFFTQRCTIINGTLAWDVTGDRNPEKCIDVCPDTIYQDGERIKETDIKIA